MSDFYRLFFQNKILEHGLNDPFCVELRDLVSFNAYQVRQEHEWMCERWLNPEMQAKDTVPKVHVTWPIAFFLTRVCSGSLSRSLSRQSPTAQSQRLRQNPIQNRTLRSRQPRRFAVLPL